MEKIRIGAVNYRNAKPLVYGLEQPEMTKIIDLSYDYPARLVDQLNQGQIDMGLMPVAALPSIPEAYTVGEFGIATEGKVSSVAVFSQVPIERIQSVILDYQSRTSAALLRVLMRDHWKKEVQYLPSSGDEFIDEIQGQKAGLIIGDRALLNLGRFPFVYDLGEAWRSMTGLPFVFATWVAVRPLPAEFLTRFEWANRIGLQKLNELSAIWALPGVDMLDYFSHKISYELNGEKRLGLQQFLTHLVG